MAHRFHRIRDDWAGDVALIVANGTSAAVDLSPLENLGRTIAVKAKMFSLPFAEFGFGLDVPRFRDWADRVETVPFPVYWAIPDEHPTAIRHRIAPNVRLLKRVRDSQFTSDRDAVSNGGTSGFGACNLAYHFNPAAVFLFGFDHTSDGKTWHADPEPYRQRRAQNAVRWKSWALPYVNAAQAFRARGVPVVNASTISKIEAFEKVPYEQALDDLDRIRREGIGWLRRRQEHRAAALPNPGADIRA